MLWSGFPLVSSVFLGCSQDYLVEWDSFWLIVATWLLVLHTGRYFLERKLYDCPVSVLSFLPTLLANFYVTVFIT